jgi:hypothetical protein
VKYRCFICALFASLSIAFQSGASDAALEAALRPVRERDKALADELQTLAASSPEARKLMLDDPRQKKDPTGTLYYLWEFCYRGLQQNHWLFRRCLLEYPRLCAAASLVASVHAGDGQHYAIFTWGGIGPIIATEDKKEGFTFYHSQELALDDADTHYDYDVAPDGRGDILVARWHPRIILGDKTRRIVTEHLYIRGHTLRRLKRVTEEYPLESR